LSDRPRRIFGMELRLTLLDPQRAGARVDVAIDAPAGQPFATISAQLIAALEVTATSPAHHFLCGREPVDGSQPLGLPPLLQGATLTLATGPVATTTLDRPRPPLAAHVIAGPDAGIVIPLAIGRHRIGRGSGQLIRLTDPEVSRTHAELTVGASKIELQDAGSTNGTWLDGRRLGSAPETLHPDGIIRIGADLIRLRRPRRQSAAGTLDGVGRLSINRAPHLRPPRPQVEVTFPPKPSDRPAGRLPWLAMLLPLLLAVPLAVLWKQPTFLLFALMTPLLMAGQYLSDRRSGRRETARRLAQYQAVCARRQQDLERAVAADVRHLDAARPDLAHLTVTARVPTDELWQRTSEDPDFLVLRLGRGPGPSPITIRRPTSDGTGEFGIEPQRYIHREVPIAVDLVAIGILGLCGPRRMALALARSLIGQISVLHSPQEIRIHVLTADPGRRRDWLWVTWLPHHDARGPQDDARRVLVLDGAHALRRRPELAAVLNQASRARDGGTGVTRRPLILCLDQAEPDLPIECGAFVDLAMSPDRPSEPAADSPTAENPTPADFHETSQRAVLRRAGTIAGWFIPDLASGCWAEQLARDLAPLRDATPEPGQGLPAAVRLIDLLSDADHVQPTDPDALARNWRRRGNPEPSATIGVSASGPFRIDLRRDGPHLLIGGTTGSGKSELLQTLVAALAVASGPDAMSFLLLDYKGGAAFRECADLPHVGGMITDLNPSLARRALASLTAELRRRERLLRSVPAADIDSYRAARATRPELPAMPRLVVVVDEFRVLAEELPEFVSGLVRTATVGRSLGVHLVLATQRPSGIVSAEITSNVNLRIALRVNDGGDSRDLVDDPAAAGLPADRPGRALARSGAGPLIGFQTAVVSGRSPTAAARQPVVRRLDLAHDLAPESGGTADDPAQRPGQANPDSTPDSAQDSNPDSNPGPIPPSDLIMIAGAAMAAAERLGLAPAQPPWVPPLPQHVGLEDLLASVPAQPPEASDERRPVRLPFALLDLPAEQRQEVLAWRLDGSHLALSGGPRSGRTTALHSIARAASAVAGSDAVHVYAIDGVGGLAALRFLPRVEAVIPVHDIERGERLLRLLSAEIDARHDDEETLGAQLGSRLRPGSEVGPEVGPTHRPDIVLLIDGWEALTDSWGAVDHGRLFDQLIAALRDGPAVGVHAAISGGRTLLTGTISALLTERVLLRFADPTDAILAGVPASRILGSQPAGRGLVLGPRFPEATELQVAVGRPVNPALPQTTETTEAAATTETADHGPASAAVGRVRRMITPPATRRCWQIPELPRRLEHGRLLAAWRTQTSADRTTGNPGSQSDPGRRRVPIGIGGDEALALCLDLDAAPVTLVAGPAGSGRTSTLRCIADGLARLHEPVLWVSLSGCSGHSGDLLAGRGPVGNGVPTPTPTPTPVPDRFSDADSLRAVDAVAIVDGFQFIDGSRPGAVAALSAALTARPTSTVLVDDTQVAGIPSSAPDDLEALLVSRVGIGPVVVASSPTELLSAYRGLPAVAKSARSGLLLGPAGPGEAEVFGLRSERRPPGPPGRALLIQGGRAVSVQLALPPALARPPPHAVPPPAGAASCGYRLLRVPPPAGTASARRSLAGRRTDAMVDA
jgi:S-DNA-T family DNA segregation ATPase FtsK/SpoIIIE